MFSVSLPNSIGLISFFILLSLLIGSSKCTYDWLVPTSGVGSVAVQDNITASYPYYFYTLWATANLTITNSSGLRYGIFSVTPNNAAFQVNPATGQLYIDAGKAGYFPPIQYERASQYVLVILTYDSLGIYTETGTLTVNVTKIHHPPVFLTPQDTIISISEGTTLPEVIYTASASCASDGGKPIAWSIDVVWPTGNGTLFGMDVRGRVYLIDPSTQLNYTRVPEYIITYFAADNVQSLTATGTLTVRITPVNHRPIIQNLPANVTIPPNIIAPTPFFWLVVSDPDDPTGGFAQQQALFHYSFSVNPIEGFQKFTISNTGQVSTAINQLFNYTSQPFYLVTIWVIDWDSGAPMTASGTLNVTITQSGSQWVWSGSTIGTVIQTVYASTASTTTGSSSGEASQDVIIGASVGVVGGLMLLGGILAVSLLCCKGRAAGPVVMGGSSNNNTSTNSSSMKSTVYEDEHVYFDSRKPSPGNAGRSAIVSPFPGGSYRYGGRGSRF